MAANETYLDDDPLWYKDAIIYQVHIKSYFDSNDDGVGDLRGLIEKLDYLEGLGVTAVWLMPFYPSPLRDDGYDISDYLSINPDYGSLRDFRKLLKEAHRRGIRIITELVVNHTSDQHPWFQKARCAKPGSVWRDYYVWSDSPDRYLETRIIFQDFETSNWSWDPVAKAYYWHRFYSHQPDLNYDNPRVQKEIIRVLDFWFDMGVDGLRLDAVPYLYEREGTNCENLPETHGLLKKLRAHIDSKFNNRMLLAEANQWPEDAAAYFGDSDECHTAFHFPVMPRLFMALRMEDRFPIIDILEQTPTIPETCQWVMFLRNHDELTLEMVTDEERDYMYRVYAQDPRAKINLGIRRRLAPLLSNDRRTIELMNILLFSLSGTPVIYYGDEIGMGDNYYLGDRNGVRTPMQWSPDRNAGFSRVNPQKLYLPVIIDPEYHYEALNVENQERNVSSHLWWMRRAIAMRKRFRAFSRGTLEFLSGNNPKVLAFVRKYEEELVLVVANLSKYSQVVEFNFDDYVGYVPVEVFSQNQFPEIKDAPYVLTLGPYDYHWLLLENEREAISVSEDKGVPELSVKKSWKSILEEPNARFQTQILRRYMQSCRWFGGKARSIQKIRIAESIPMPKDSPGAYLLIVEVNYKEGAAESYFLPVSFASSEKAEQIFQESPQGVIGRIKAGSEEGVLYDSVYSDEFRTTLFSMLQRNKRFKAKSGQLVAYPGKIFKRLAKDGQTAQNSRVLKVEQSNSSILYHDKFFLKLYRRLEEGLNPDLEIEKFLTEKTGFSHVPPFAGAIELRRPKTEPIAIGLLQGFIPNEGDAWTYMLDAVTRYFERVLSRKDETEKVPELPDSLFDITFEKIPPLLQDLIGGISLEMASLLGKRTGELHRALATSSDSSDFAPERFSTLYQRSLYQSMRGVSRRTLQALDKNLKGLPESIQDEVADILSAQQDILKGLQRITKRKISGMKIRIHGDYHLG
nr:maltose alpha-D-glucosyltransferase [candidate division KSB1 bacterium]NIU58659.1 maltose alpha-D-glucosyltransferase [Phycisphaerae bacterium]NIR71637.1 maltose alpha-D-glucosyltransferase [candidate division KSB1 bacterium]NIS27977.1 maltose alpha-D-glucosyltransferase [candidate division KSB1 bacterium]NIT74859.1 maltose alpha-D-glucosyltransferase [candidate division KSB1 bacterium]